MRWCWLGAGMHRCSMHTGRKAALQRTLECSVCTCMPSCHCKGKHWLPSIVLTGCPRPSGDALDGDVAEAWLLLLLIIKLVVGTESARLLLASAMQGRQHDDGVVEADPHSKQPAVAVNDNLSLSAWQ